MYIKISLHAHNQDTDISAVQINTHHITYIDVHLISICIHKKEIFVHIICLVTDTKNTYLYMCVQFSKKIKN